MKAALGGWLCAWALAAHAAPATEAPRTVVLKAESGLFSGGDAATAPFVPSATLPLKDGQAFGWRMQLRTHQRAVRVREELTLPAEPRTWGDPEPGLKRKTSPDGRTATTELLLEPRNGLIGQSWTVTDGDPKGTWTIKVRIDDGPVHTFRFEAR